MRDRFAIFPTPNLAKMENSPIRHRINGIRLCMGQFVQQTVDRWPLDRFVQAGRRSQTSIVHLIHRRVASGAQVLQQRVQLGHVGRTAQIAGATEGGRTAQVAGAAEVARAAQLPGAAQIVGGVAIVCRIRCAHRNGGLVVDDFAHLLIRGRLKQCIE